MYWYGFQRGKTEKTKALEPGPGKSKVASLAQEVIGNQTGEQPWVKPSSIPDTKPRLRTCDLVGLAEGSR